MRRRRISRTAAQRPHSRRVAGSQGGGRAAMTDPGWDIPGIAREPSPGSDAFAAHAPDSSAAASSAPRSSDVAPPARSRQPGRKARAGSVSAVSGLSVGAFGRLADGSTDTPGWSARNGSGRVTEGMAEAVSPRALASKRRASGQAAPTLTVTPSLTSRELGRTAPPPSAPARPAASPSPARRMRWRICRLRWNT